MHPDGDLESTSDTPTQADEPDTERWGVVPPVDAAAMPQVYWDTSSDLLIVADHTGVLAAANPQWRRALGWNVAQHPDLPVLDLVHDDDRAAVRETLGALGPGRRFVDLAVRMRTVGGDHREMSCSGVSDGRFWYISGRDVTDHHRLEEEARAQSLVFEQSEIAIVNVDAEHRITRWSAGAESLYGWTAEEALGQPVVDLIQSRPVEVVEEEGAVSEGRYESRHKDGQMRVAQVRYAELLDADGGYAGTVSIAMDVSAHVRVENERRAARHHLQAVTESMSEGLLALAPAGGIVVMNRAAEQLLGWTLDEARGRTLQEVTGRRFTPSPDDEEVHVDDAVFLRRDGREVPVSCTLTPLGSTGGDDGWVLVFRDATEARAEQERMRTELRALVWAERVEADIGRGNLALHAQPIVDLRTMTPVRHELLLRIVAAGGSLSAPEEYLAGVEAHGLTSRIDRWVLREAVDRAAAGQAVSANVSASSVGDGALVADLGRWLAETGADPALLGIEITETAVIADVQVARAFVDDVHALGCQVMLDDFGAGYSGFAYLKQLPVDGVKIDIAFVRDLTTSETSRLVVEAVVNLARKMGLQTVAEGVEDVATLDLLVDLGIDRAQGYHLGRPAAW